MLNGLLPMLFGNIINRKKPEDGEEKESLGDSIVNGISMGGLSPGLPLLKQIFSLIPRGGGNSHPPGLTFGNGGGNLGIYNGGYGGPLDM